MSRFLINNCNSQHADTVAQGANSESFHIPCATAPQIVANRYAALFQLFMRTMKLFAITFTMILFVNGCSHALRTEYQGVYELSDGFGGNRIELDSNFRFRAWWWTDVGGYNEAPSTVGSWTITERSDIIELTSDKLPVPACLSSDSTVKGFRIVIRALDSTVYTDFASVEIVCSDTMVILNVDSTKTIDWSYCIPEKIKVYELGCFTFWHFVATKPHRNDAVDHFTSYGTISQNVLTITLQSQFTYCEREKYFLFNNALHSLDFPRSRLNRRK